MIASRNIRYQRMLEAGTLDALVAGGGISGAPVYQKLWRAEYRVGLVDGGDFAWLAFPNDEPGRGADVYPCRAAGM